RCGAYRPSGISSGRACRAAGHAATGLAAGYLSGGRFERSYLLAPAESNGRAHAQHRHRLYLSDTLRFPAVASASSTRAPFLELAARQPARSPRHRPPDGTRNCPAKTTNSCRPRELRHRLIRSQPYSDGSELDECEVVVGVFFVSRGDGAEVLEFVEEALDEVSVTIKKGTESRRVEASGHWFDARPGAAFLDRLTQSVGVVGAVSEQDVSLAQTVQHIERASAV